MRRVALFLTVLFAVNLINLPANSAVKAGTKCTKAGATSISGGKKYTCVKSGKNLVWNKGVLIPKPVVSAIPAPTNSPNPTVTQTISATPTPTTGTNPDISADNQNKASFTFKNACSIDPLTPPQWKEMETFFKTINECQGLYRINKVNDPNSTPNSELTSLINNLEISKCKIKARNQVRGLAFPTQEEEANWKIQAYPAPKMIVQIIPIYAEDTKKPINTPAVDYKKYFDFLKEWVEYSSDISTFVEFRIPENYIRFDNPISPYGVTHLADSSKKQIFKNDLISKIDPIINFTGINFTLVVVPPKTSYKSIWQSNLGSLNTNEGLVGNIAVLPPESFDLNEFPSHDNTLQPNWMIHEFYHVAGLDDHNGNDNFFNNMSAGNFENSGLGGLTLMSTARSDLSAWEKWLFGYIADTQVTCVDSSKTSVSWIFPSTIKSSKIKLIVIPISDSKVIAIESIRNGGLNYKLEKDSYGAFVYQIDFSSKNHGEGMYAIYPDGRKPTLVSHDDIFFRDAPFKIGETVTINNTKITVVEAGDFGDVVKVEKV